MKNRYAFLAVFHYADDGVSIDFPDLPGCLPCADTTEEAYKNAKEALGLHLWGMEQDGEEIPEPTPANRIETQPGDAIAVIDVFMPPIRERINQRFVKKTLSLPAWLAAMGERDGVNFSKVLQNALMDYLGVNDNRNINAQH